MFIRTFENAIHRTRTAIRFSTIVQRCGSLANEASAPGPVPAGLMQQAYAEATSPVTSLAESNPMAVSRAYIA